MASPILDDHRWIKAAFLIPNKNVPKQEQIIGQWSDGMLDFTDTTPGGSYEINPPTQFTRTADIKCASIFSRSKGKGRYYYEAISANSQRVNFRMGTVKFNSLTQFWTGFYNNQASEVARTGRSTGVFYEAGRLGTFVVSIMSWQLMAIQLLGLTYRELFQRPSSKFCYLKPAMHLYWNAVNTMVNQVAVYMGIIPRVGGGGESNAYKKLFPEAEAKEAIGLLAKLLPGIVRKDGGIDVFAIASRAQVLERRRIKAQQDFLEAGGKNDIASEIRASYEALIKDGVNTSENNADFLKYLERNLNSNSFKPREQGKPDGIPIVEQLYFETKREKDENAKKADGTPDPNAQKFAYDKISDKDADMPKTLWEEGIELFKAGLDDGAEFLTLRVNSTGGQSESFSNSFGEASIKNTFNSASGSARSTWFSLANGNFAGDGLFGKAIQTAAGAVTEFVQGIGDQLNIQGVFALNGAAFVDIPDHWVASSANLPKSSYTIELNSPYAANPIAYLLKMIIPLCCVLAMVLPKSTGKQSYCEPFYMEWYDKGRSQSRFGAVESVSIRRGTNNLPYSGDGLPLGYTIDIQLRDLSSVMHMPIAQQNSFIGTAGYAAAGALVGGPAGLVAGMLAGAAKTVFDEDTVWTDYMSTLAGLGLADNIYMFRKFKLKLTRLFSDWQSYTSPGRYTTFATDLLPVRLLSSAWRGTLR